MNFGVVPEALDRNYQVEKICFSYLLLVTDIILIVVMQISMQVDTNNLMQIHMVSGHSQVRAALEDALPNLRDSLAQSGINLGQSSVGSDATPNWNGSGQNSAAGGQTGETFSVNATAGNADNIKVQAPSTTTGRAAGIDTFA